MTPDSKEDRVSRDAYERSLPVPRSFAVTFGWGRDFWINQDDGVAGDPYLKPSREDVERVLHRD